MNYYDELKKYSNYKFESNWNNTQEYLKFQEIYIKHLKSLLRKPKYEILKINKNHFEFSLFVKIKNKIVYISISDVRYYQNYWLNKILIRTVNSENDYIGNQNHYTTLNQIIENLEKITEEK